MKKRKLNKNTKKYLLKLYKREEHKKDKDWHDKVLEKFNYKCAFCGKSIQLNAHHIIPRQIKATRWNVENGIALCVYHHRYSFDFSAHQNAFAFFIWLEKNRFEQYNYLKTELEKIITLINNKTNNL